MEKKKIWGINLGELFYSLIMLFVIILIFTAIDYYIHSLSEEYSVPSYYFKNKLLFGTIIGFLTYLFIKNRSIFVKSLVLSGVVSTLLQFRYYFIEHYPLKFVIEFLFIHFFILMGVSVIIFLIIGNNINFRKFFMLFPI